MKNAFVMIAGLTILGGLLSGCATSPLGNLVNAQSPGRIDSSVQAAAHHETQNHSSLTTLGQGDDIFRFVENSSGPVVIDFYADWCGPCQRQGKILHELAPAAESRRASILKVNVDKHPRLANLFRVDSLPTLMLVKDGKILERHTGMANRQMIRNWINQ